MHVLGHTALHAPQWAGSVRMFCSHPSSARLPLQSAQPVAHAPAHCPLEQAGLGTWLPEQTAPHAPQLSGLLTTFVSHPSDCKVPLQSIHPAEHAPWQAPAEQATDVRCEVEQATPHPPQFAVSPCVFVSQPSVSSLPLQLAKPAAHAPSQTPFEHAGVTFWLEHRTPQPPQFAGSDLTSVSHPSSSRF
jgi:hypothetical protein